MHKSHGHCRAEVGVVCGLGVLASQDDRRLANGV